MNQSYYELFELPEQFAIDSGLLEERWRTKSAQVHPDRFATASDVEKRVAMQWASLINEAYQVLKNPLKRATYLCEQQGVDLGAESNTAMSPDFLMKQMLWRESLDEARSQSPDAADVTLQELQDTVAAEESALQQSISQLIDEQQNYQEAASRLREWMFIDKLQSEIKEERHSLD